MRDFSKELIVKTSVSTTVKGKNIFIPEDATNGDVIKAVFPNAEYDYHEKSELVDAHVTVFINDCDTCQDYSMDWWNAKYKGVR